MISLLLWSKEYIKRNLTFSTFYSKAWNDNKKHCNSGHECNKTVLRSPVSGFQIDNLTSYHWLTYDWPSQCLYPTKQVEFPLIYVVLLQVSLLGRLHHRNLVNLLGYCVDKGQHMLIYEFMSNGSLSNLLYSKFRCSCLYPYQKSRFLCVVVTTC